MRASKTALSMGEAFFYVLSCVFLGAGYFAKVPVKKAMQDFGICEMTTAEKFWYVLGNVAFGAMFLAKVVVVKAISEVPRSASVEGFPDQPPYMKFIGFTPLGS
jgi:hypothetical protein